MHRLKFKKKTESLIKNKDLTDTKADKYENAGDAVDLLSEKEEIFTNVDQSPEFPGGKIEMNKFIKANFNYTNHSQDDDIEKTNIIIQFIVDKNGMIKDPKIIKGINEELDKEAMRVVKLMPRWKPGKLKGSVVSSKYNLPINIELK
jgi:periplasmic protein TonB